jgi:hypothetical protein
VTVIPFPGTEVIEPLDRAAAERLDKRMRLLVDTINDNIAKLYELVQEAKRGDVHVALGFPSWTAYLADVFAVQIRLTRQQRRELVGYLSGEGMSQRAIADVVGADQATVSRDLAGDATASREPVTGLDGKTYKRRPTPPTEHLPPMTYEEAREVTARIRDWVDGDPAKLGAIRRVPDDPEGAFRELELLLCKVDEAARERQRAVVIGMVKDMPDDMIGMLAPLICEFIEYVKDLPDDDEDDDAAL